MWWVKWRPSAFCVSPNYMNGGSRAWLWARPAGTAVRASRRLPGRAPRRASRPALGPAPGSERSRGPVVVTIKLPTHCLLFLAPGTAGVLGKCSNN